MIGLIVLPYLNTSAAGSLTPSRRPCSQPASSPMSCRSSGTRRPRKSAGASRSCANWRVGPWPRYAP